jgi:cation:H+ antiporter
MLNLLLLLTGFLPLIFGANLLVNNASSLAKRLNIPTIVIGLTIVGFGTSTPEMVINIFAAVEKNSNIALGNIIGSNIFNILGILGLSALIYPIAVKKNTTWIEIPLCLLSAVVVFIVANDIIIDRASSSQISRIDGLILLLFFAIFLVYNITLSLKEGYEGDMEIKNRSAWFAVIFIITGLALLVAGGRIIVVYAVKVASTLGLSERVIALTIVSIGTSLPEIATSVVAVRKKNTDIAIGNVVGSNIFNVFFILGLSAVINPVSLQPLSNFDILLNIGVSLLLFIIIFTGKGRVINRLEGFLFLALFMAYLVVLLAL